MEKRTGKIISILTAAALLFAAPAGAMPQNGTVAAGAATITSSAAKAMNINQTTDKAIINWKSYSIAAGEKVQYLQPGRSSISLNRVTGADPSLIYGQLTANGQVWVINPNGLLVGSGATINVGSFLGSTLNIKDEDFLKGNYKFSQTGSLSSIVNQGSITAQEGGYVVLISPSITNEGTLAANLGKAYLASGNEVNLTFSGNDLIGFTVDKETAAEALGIANKGTISANGGEVILSARAASNLIKTVICNEGVIEAKTIVEKEGKILLLGGMEKNAVAVSGTLDASAPDGGKGGFIETSAAKVTIKDGLLVNTSAPHGQTGAWLIDPYDFTIAATGGDMTGAQVTTALATSNLEITSSAGAKSGSGDIFVNDSVTWSQNTLTLKADRNIAINSALYGSGTAGLALYYGQGSGTGWFGSQDYYAYCKANAPVNLASTGAFATKLGSSGTVKTYTILTSLGAEGSATGTDLQGMSGNLSRNYVLGADIDASSTSSWNGGAGFAPVGNSSTEFTGSLEGLGHTVTGLTINRPATDYVGLIGYADGATIRNVGLVGGSVTGRDYGGGFMGRNINGGEITESYSTGSVTGRNYVGGLVGANGSGGDITRSYFTGSVTGSQYVGGLTGSNSGTIDFSYSTGGVTGSVCVGGLAGVNGMYVQRSYSTGSVTGSQYVGGLVGWDLNGSIWTSYSTGSVTGSSYVGGLVGSGSGSTVDYSYWDTETSGRGTSSGGGTGLTTAGMKQSSNFSNWDFTNTWRIYDGHSYPLLKAFLTPLTVTANDYSRTYNGAAYSGGNGVTYSTTPSGLLLGAPTYSGTSQGAKKVETYVITPGGLYSTSQQQGYDITYADGALTITPASLTITANDYSRTYNGAAYSGGNGVAYAGFMGGETAAVLAGALSYAGTSQGAKNAGSYVIKPGGLASGNYSISYADGALTINPAPLTIAGSSAADKVYDGATTAAVTAGTLSGLVAGETLGVSSSGTFDTKNAGAGKTVATAYTLADGSGLAANYTLASENLTAAITPAALTVTANDYTRTYNGAAYSGGNGVTYAGFVGGETASVLAGALSYAGSSQGAKNAGSYVLTPEGLASGNYSISYANGALTITPASLTITANDYSRTYNATAYSGGNGVAYAGFVGGEDAAVLAGALSYAGTSQGAKNAGSYVIKPGGLASGNYDVRFVDGTLTIDRNTTPPSAFELVSGLKKGMPENIPAGERSPLFTIAPSVFAGRD